MNYCCKEQNKKSKIFNFMKELQLPQSLGKKNQINNHSYDKHIETKTFLFSLTSTLIVLVFCEDHGRFVIFAMIFPTGLYKPIKKKNKKKIN